MTILIRDARALSQRVAQPFDLFLMVELPEFRTQAGIPYCGRWLWSEDVMDEGLWGELASMTQSLLDFIAEIPHPATPPR